MLKFIFGLGCVAAPLYHLMMRNKMNERDHQRIAQAPSAPFLNFAPKLVIVTKIHVPVKSNNGAEELAKIEQQHKDSPQAKIEAEAASALVDGADKTASADAADHHVIETPKQKPAALLKTQRASSNRKTG